MKVHNIRYGFANNSSSNHSIVLLKGENKLHETFHHEQKAFGWNQFVCSSKEAKLSYIREQILHNIHINFGDMSEVKEYLIELGLDDDLNKTGNIDHQSVLTFPKDRTNHLFPSTQFMKDFIKFILKKNVVIIGGNDNEENPLRKQLGDHVILNKYLDIKETRSPMTCRKDGDFWILFNQSTGDKITISFDDIENSIRTKAKTPELVDMKITNFCDQNCSFCYQDATRDLSIAKFASLEDIAVLIDRFEEWKVFEVALGGGEPTLHPGFLPILKLIKNNGIIPNFTTKNLNWLTNSSYAHRNEILETCGSFAVSMNDFGNMRRLEILEQTIPRHMRHKVYFQFIPGLLTDQRHLRQPYAEEIDRINRNFDRDHITLLGLKFSGRCVDTKKRFKYSKSGNEKETLKKFDGMELHLVGEKRMLEFVNELQFDRIGIDTCFAQHVKDELKQLTDVEHYYLEEGKFSMYVDAVEKKFGPSSYCSPDQMAKFKIHEAPKHSMFIQPRNTLSGMLSKFRKW